MPEILKIDTEGHPAWHLVRAAEIIRSGGVIAYPTDTIYGLGANPFNEKAIKRIFAIKRREGKNPILLLIAHKKEVDNLTRGVSPVARRLISAYWPGPLTMIFEASPSLPSCLLGGTGKVGLRLPDSKIVSWLISLTGHPITASSANKAGGQNPLNAADVLNSFDDEIDLILDAGPSLTSQASTVIDVSIFPPCLIREGIIDFTDIERVIRQ